MSTADAALVLPSRAVVLRAALWLLVLAPFFYLTYGLANYLASLRTDVPNIALDGEEIIPFVEWTIIPYWSINLFYVTTLFANEAPAGVDRIARRYLTCQIIAVTLFIVMPLQAIYAKPQTSGLTGFMFDALGSFDKPFNQAPSLHIALLVIIWDHWRHRFQRFWRTIWHIWSALIALSVLTTFQHHFLDIPTGILLGLFALWLVPGETASSGAMRVAATPRTQKLGVFYGGGAIFCALLAALLFPLTPLSLIWLWPALALMLVAFAYIRGGVATFQKRDDGHVSLASYWLLMPYRWGAAINAWAWTRSTAPHVHIAGNVHLGRFPKESEIKGFHAVIDMTGEMLRVPGTDARWHCFPILDLTPAPIQMLNEAAQAIQKTQQSGKVLVCCALGMQRSAAATGLWLLQYGHAGDVEAAIRMLKAAGRPVHLDPDVIETAWVKK